MAISTHGTVLKIKNNTEDIETVEIKSFPDLGAAPAAIDVTTLADNVQKFIPGVKALAAMEFVANYEKEIFTKLKANEGENLTYVVDFGTNGSFTVTGTHSVSVAGAGLNAAVDMKITVLPNGEITVA